MEQGFRLFGHDHLLAIAATATVALGCVATVRCDAIRAGRALRWLVAATLAAAHLTEAVVAAWQGWYQRQMLPLQLCDLAAMLAIYALLTLDRRAIEPLYFFALSGTLPALLTPELDVSFPHLRFVVYFVEHGMTVVAPILLVGGMGIRPTDRAWLRAFWTLQALASLAGLANLALGTNFMYLRRKPVGPTPFDLFGPWPIYLIVLELLVLAVFRLLQAASGLATGSAQRATRPWELPSGALAEARDVRDVMAAVPGIECERRTEVDDTHLGMPVGPRPLLRWQGIEQRHPARVQRRE